MALSKALKNAMMETSCLAMVVMSIATMRAINGHAQEVQQHTLIPVLITAEMDTMYSKD